MRLVNPLTAFIAFLFLWIIFAIAAPIVAGVAAVAIAIGIGLFALWLWRQA